jgi:hypothetical protein
MNKPARTRTKFCYLPIVLIFTAGTAVGEFQGAEKILERLLAPSGDEATKPDPAEQWVADAKSFSQSNTNLTPELAANEWLALLERLREMANEQRSDYWHGDPFERPNAQTLFASIPAPRAWSALNAMIQERETGEGYAAVRNHLLKLFGYQLVMESEAGSRELAHLLTRMDELNGGSARYVDSSIRRLASEWRKLIGDWKGQIDELEKKLAGGPSEDAYQPHLEVPDLVTLVGLENAEDLLSRALQSKYKIRIEHGDETKALARRLAVEQIESMHIAQWGLAHHADAVEVFEALEKKFRTDSSGEQETQDEAESNDDDASKMLEALLSTGEQTSRTDDHDYQTARMYYLLGLIVRGRSDDALALARRIGSTHGDRLPVRVLSRLDQIGYTRSVYAFLDSLLGENPDFPYWDVYVSLGAKAGQTERTLDTLEQALKRDDLSVLKRLKLNEQLMNALLADDQVNKGVDELQKLLRQDLPESAEDASEYAKGNRPHWAIKLAWLGHLLDEETWLRDGLQERMLSDKDTPINQDSFERVLDTDFFVALGGMHQRVLISRDHGHQPMIPYIQLLLELGHGDVAEAYVAGFLPKSASSQKANRRGRMQSQSALRLLTQLAAIYYDAERYDDIFILLERSPDWGVEDLSKCFKSKAYSSEHPLGLMAATALHANGRDEEAVKILEALLVRDRWLRPDIRIVRTDQGGGCVFVPGRTS